MITRAESRARRSQARRPRLPRRITARPTSSASASGAATIGEAVRAALREDRDRLRLPAGGVGRRPATVDYYECLLHMRDAGRPRSSRAGEFVPAIEQLGLIRLIDRYVLDKAVGGAGGASRGQARLQHLRPDRGRPAVAARADRAGAQRARTSPAARRRDHRDRGALRHRGIGPLRQRAAPCRLPRRARRFRRRPYLAAASAEPGGRYRQDRRLVYPQSRRAARKTRSSCATCSGSPDGFGFNTVAECVETAEDAAILREEGVDFLQGHYFGRPARPVPG